MKLLIMLFAFIAVGICDVPNKLEVTAKTIKLFIGNMVYRELKCPSNFLAPGVKFIAPDVSKMNENDAVKEFTKLEKLYAKDNCQRW